MIYRHDKWTIILLYHQIPLSYLLKSQSSLIIRSKNEDKTKPIIVEIVVENKSPGIIKEMAIVIATYMLISNVYLATFSDLKK